MVGVTGERYGSVAARVLCISGERNISITFFELHGVIDYQYRQFNLREWGKTVVVQALGRYVTKVDFQLCLHFL